MAETNFGSTQTFTHSISNSEFQQNWGTSALKSIRRNRVCLEGVIDGDDLPRRKSLTDEDLDDLRGCVELGFGFSYDEIPELCNTLPALELCYSISQRFLDETSEKSTCSSSSDTASFSGSESSGGGVANWRICSPGDRPEDVKARLRFWAQAVACTVKLCN